MRLRRPRGHHGAADEGGATAVSRRLAVAARDRRALCAYLPPHQTRPLTARSQTLASCAVALSTPFSLELLVHLTHLRPYDRIAKHVALSVETRKSISKAKVRIACAAVYDTCV